jgi:hypothetical protein
VRILALDPGKTCGVAWVDTETGGHNALQMDHGDLVNYVGAVLLIGFTPSEELWQPDVLIIEDYIGSGPRDKWSKLTLLAIGRAQACAELAGVPWEMQTPQVRRPWLEEAKKNGYPKHATDALAHALAKKWKGQAL